MQFWVYILRCRDGSYYTGHTDNLGKRLAEHQSGLGADWTRRRRPVELAWCESAPTRDEAFASERRVKNWSRAKKEALFREDWRQIGYFARPPHERPSTSLGTNGLIDNSQTSETAPSPILSEVEGCSSSRPQEGSA
ncbi:MAG: GIY-YIG nuclease family protein [Sphingosinicella sp.]|nr:GIY-YIG nuclease family protein [Sphingosinicella sp.]